MMQNGLRWMGGLLCMMVIPMTAQRVLSLDSCRQMALQNNKQLGISKLKQNMAANMATTNHILDSCFIIAIS